MSEQREQVLSRLVTPTGELDRLIDRQPLYTGRNGKVIERFWVELNGKRESYIFKPLTNGKTVRREQWIYEHLLPAVPVRYPALFAAAEHEDPDHYWAIYEDMGEMSHHLADVDYAVAAACVPLWHSLPLDRVPSHFTGDKTDLADLRQDMLNAFPITRKRLLALGVEQTKVTVIEQLLTEWKGSFETELVISHGDYHQGNMSRRGNELIILDWEFVHHNSVYWDLYGLLDMCHPDFPKMISPEVRLEALNAYMNQRVKLGWKVDRSAFITDYHHYAMVYSLWMLGLIEQDLQKRQWEVSKLLRAQQETIASLLACLAYCDVG